MKSLSSQGNTSSSNIGIPDYSKAIYIVWYGYSYWNSLSNEVHIDEVQSTYVIPEDGWILYICPQHSEREKDDDYEVYHYYYYVNNNRIYDVPTPVKKGDSITSLDTEDNRWGGCVIYAPNQKSK